MTSLPIPIDYTSKDYESLRSDLLAAVPNYLPEWTDQAPGDFGVVMIELFSYIGDILSYYGDRVANEAFLATAVQRSSVLKLADMIDYRPTGNTAATTTLTLGIAPGAGATVLPVGTQFSTKSSPNSPPIVFETQTTLFFNASTTLVSDATWTLGSNALSSPGGHFLASWEGDPISGNGIPAGATFHFLNATSGTIFVNGVATNATATSTGLTVTTNPAIRYVTQDDSATPQIITVVQGQSVFSEALGNSTGAPDQQYTLFQSPVIDGSVQIYVDEGDGPRLWTFFGHLTDAASTDLAYTTFTDDNNIVNVVFGDGVNGKIPNPQAVIAANYRVGGGSLGNVGPGSIVEILSVQPNIVSVTNTTGATGGADAETLDHIRTQAPKSLTAINRAVTLGDYAALTLKFPGIAKAKATAQIFTNISLYIHPSGGYLTAANLQAQVALYAPQLTNPPPAGTNNGYLDDKKMIGASITVLPPQYLGATGYVPVDLTMQVSVLPQYQATAVQQSVINALNSLISFDNVDFGMKLTRSAVIHAIMVVPGVDYVVLSELRRDEEIAGTLHDLFFAAYEIPQLNPTTGKVNVTTIGGI